MNLTYGDTSLIVRYLEAFLQTEYDNTLRVSGIYDTYTHNNLVAYASLPEVLSSNEMYDILTNDYEYRNELKLFVVSRTSTKIIYTSKATTENKATDHAMEILQSSIFEFVKQYGWSVTQFISSGKSKDLYKIELTQDARKNLIPTEALSMINLSTENFLFNALINYDQIQVDTPDRYVLLTEEPSDWTTRYDTYYVFDGGTQTYEQNTSSTWASSVYYEKIPKSCCMIVPCEPDTEYVLLHRIDNADPNDKTTQLEIRLVIGSSEYTVPNVADNSQVINSNVIRITRGNFSEPYKTSSTAKNLVISYPYDQMNYNKSLLVIKKPNDWDQYFYTVKDEHDNDVIVNSFIDVDSFIESFWLVSSKYLDYLLGSVLSEYSSEEDISYAQKLFQSVCPNYKIVLPGTYTDSFKTMVKKYQLLNLNDNVHYPVTSALGYIDVETEARLVKDVDRDFKITL